MSTRSVSYGPFNVSHRLEWIRPSAITSGLGMGYQSDLWLQTILRFELTYAFVQLNAEFQTKEFGGCVTQLAGS